MGIFSVSRLDEFAVCEQRYRFKYEPQSESFPFGLSVEESEDEKNVSAKGFGTAIHEGLRAQYEKADVLKAYRASIGEHELGAFGERLLGHYVERYGESDKEWEVLAVEEWWKLGLGPMRCVDCGIRCLHDNPERLAPAHTLIGRYDLVVRSPIGGGTLWHVQHKTTGASSLDLYARGYDLAWHERAFSAAIRQRWPGERIGGTILNLIRRPRSGAKKVDPEMDFKRYFVPVTEEAIARFERDAAARCDRIERARRTEIWEQNPKSCLAYNSICFAHAMCLGMPIDREEAFKPREAFIVEWMEQGMAFEEAVEKAKVADEARAKGRL